MKKNQTYWNEIAAYLSGELSKKQEEAFLKKTNNSIELTKDYTLMRKTWNEYSANPDKKYSDTANAWEKLHKRIENEGITDELPLVHMNTRHYVLRIAALVLLILSVGIPTLFYSSGKLTNGKNTLKYECKQGTLTVDLPDGSRVYLNEGAKLKYQKSFEQNRDVKLEGEGYFNVMSDPKRPFTVNAGKVVVTVLGTSFNIRQEKDESVQVYVESGKVRVDLEKGQESLILNPGQMGELNGQMKTTELKDVNYLAWKTKDFKFVDEEITEILKVLKNAYHVEIDTKGSPLQDKRLTSTYSDQSFDAILNTICTALNLNYYKEGKVYILQSN